MKYEENMSTLNTTLRNISGYKNLALLTDPKQIDEICKCEDELKEFKKQTKLFIEKFSPLGWCFSDNIPFDLLKDVNKKYEENGQDEAEKILINFYQSNVDKIINSLYRFKEFKIRKNLLDSAFNEHFQKKYYTSIPLFLMVSDGIVNDFTKRNGFFSENTDVTAWDCVVGCDEVLKNIKNIFNKSRKKTTLEEIRQPYRNGILHGRDLNYANEYVSCKCVSLLFAISDWILKKSTEFERKEKYNEDNKTIGFDDFEKQIKQLEYDEKIIDEWKPRIIKVGVDVPEYGEREEYKDYSYIIPIIDFLDYWKNKNYGDLAKILKNLFPYENNLKKKAGEARELFKEKTLCEYKLVKVEEIGLCITKIEIYVVWKMDNNIKSGNLIFNLIYESVSKKDIAIPCKNNGNWVIKPINVGDLYKL